MQILINFRIFFYEIKELILSLFLNPVISALAAEIVTQSIGMLRDKYTQKHSDQLFTINKVSDSIFKAYTETVEALFAFRGTFIELTRIDMPDRSLVFSEKLFDLMLVTSKTSIFTDSHINTEIGKIIDVLSSFNSKNLFFDKDIDKISTKYHKMLQDILLKIRKYNGAERANSFFRKNLGIKK